MKLTAVIDENVSLDVHPVLESAGFTILSVAHIPERGISDIAVFDLAKQHEALLITRDRDFTNSIRFPPSEINAILYLTDGNLKGEDEAHLIQQFLQNHPLETFRGKLVFLSLHSSRMR